MAALDLGTLSKRATITVIPGSPGVPSQPGRPYQPGRWETTQVSNAGYVHGMRQWLYDEFRAGRMTSYDFNNRFNALPAIEQATYQKYIEPVEAVPPTEGIPPTQQQILTNVNAGWNAGARSVVASDGTFVTRFTVSAQSAGCIAGINNGTDVSQHPMEIGWGFYVSKGVARVFERGTYIAISPTFVTGTEIFEVRRDESNTVKYYVDSTLVYTSLTTCTGTVFFDVTLYAADV